MRIIAGSHRGRIINMPKMDKIRPTQDRVRESIFNIIREVVPRSRVLDLYAGSGASGIEALSRGAKSVIFVDNNSNCIGTIKSNLSMLKDKKEVTEVLKDDTVRAIGRLEKDNYEFDLVFLDPPYYKGLAKNTLLKIDACDILSAQSFIIAEHSIKDVLPSNLKNLTLFKENKYGNTKVSFYRKSKLEK